MTTVDADKVALTSEGLDFATYMLHQQFFGVIPYDDDPEYVDPDGDGEGALKINVISGHPTLVEAIDASRKLNDSGRSTFVHEYRMKAVFEDVISYHGPGYSPSK